MSVKTVAAGVGAVLAVAGFICSLVFGVNTMARSQDETRCAGFGVSANREVKFVSYSYWTWACLTPSGNDGKWIDTDSLREVS